MAHSDRVCRADFRPKTIQFWTGRDDDGNQLISVIPCQHVPRTKSPEIQAALQNAASTVPLLSPYLSNPYRSSVPAKLRNFLVHHFFRERVASWYTELGRAEMIAELEAAGDQFGETDQLIGATVQSLKDRYGFTQKQEEQLMEKLKTAAVSRKSIN